MNPLVDTSINTTRPAWEAWARKNIAPQTFGVKGNQSAFNTINSTAYKFGIWYKNANNKQVRANDVIVGGDPRFKNWLFPVWQHVPLSDSGAFFLEPHQWTGTRMQTIERVLAGILYH